LQDARVDVAEETELALLGRYVRGRSRSEADFNGAAFIKTYVALAAQRASKILGIFARLDLRDGKPQYLRHLPRVWGGCGAICSARSATRRSRRSTRGILPTCRR